MILGVVRARVFVRSAGFLLLSRVKREGEPLPTFLIVCCRLWHLLTQIDVGRIVIIGIVVHSCRGGSLWLDNDRVDILNLGDLDLLVVAVFPGRTAPTHGLRWVRTVTPTATAHQGRIVSKLKALVSLARADAGFVVGAYFAPGKPLLELRRAV